MKFPRRKARSTTSITRMKYRGRRLQFGLAVLIVIGVWSTFYLLYIPLPTEIYRPRFRPARPAEPTTSDRPTPVLETTATARVKVTTSIRGREPWIVEQDFETDIFTGDPEVDYPPFPLPQNGSLGYSVFTSKCRIPKYETEVPVEADSTTEQSTIPVNSCDSRAEPFVFRLVREKNKTCFEFDEKAYRGSYSGIPLEKWNCSYTKLSGSADSLPPDTEMRISLNSSDCIEGRVLWMDCSISSSQLVYQQILLNPEQEDDWIGSPRKPNENPVNVVLIEIEALSRADVKSRLVKSMEFLSSSEGELVELHGYNIISEVARQNRLNLFTVNKPGSERTNAAEVDSHNDSEFFWESCENAGYKILINADGEPPMTSFAAVSPVSSAKYPAKSSVASAKYPVKTPVASLIGSQPANLPPLWQLSERRRSEESANFSKPCQDQNMRRKYHFRYVIDSLKVLDRRRPLFAYSWIANSDSPYADATERNFDAQFREFLMELKESARLNETAVVLLSDSASTRLGALPLISVEHLLLAGILWLPRRFVEQNPGKIETLQLNSKNLVTSSDLRLTLLDLIGSAATAEKGSKKTGYSLLGDIIPERSCFDARIPMDLCACFGRLAMDTEGRLARSFSQAVVRRANLVHPLGNGTGWQLAQISEIVRFSQGDDWTDIFKISIQVTPKADIEAIAKLSWTTNKWEFSSALTINRASEN